MNRSAAFTLLALAGAALAAACATNVATGKLQFTGMPRSQEIALGAQEGPKLTAAYGGEVPDQVLRDYVSQIGFKVAAHVEKEYKDIPWKFTLLNSDVINAFALPGGQVFMSRALMERMTNEAQLAGVLGHEIGHVTAEHIDQRIGRDTAFQVGAAVGGVVAGADYGQMVSSVITQGGGLFSMKYGRDEESEADSLGIRYMVRAGYNPAGQLQVMQILKEASQGGGGGQPEWLSTHPAPQTRIDRIKEDLKGKYANTKDNPQFAFNEASFVPMVDRLKRLPPAPKPRAK
ncbi:MAG: M48 family metalloprotease [Phycisphaerales bacterium]